MGTLLLMAVVFFGVQAWQTRGVPDTLPTDARVQLLRGDGSIRDMSLNEAVALMRTAFEGQPVALHLWAEWCPICRVEEGSITNLGRDWPVLTVAMQSGSGGRCDTGATAARAAVGHAGGHPGTADA
jgi:thiol-disulfide isomerase/thioredoxin